MIDSALRSMGRTPLFIAIALALVLLKQGYESYQMFEQKAAAQESVTESVDRWKTSYLALADTVKKWDASYEKEDSIQDQVSLIDELGLAQYGFKFDVDAITVVRIDPVTENGVQIGLTKVCLASGLNSEGVKVSAPNYEALLSGLKRLAGRPDIYIGVIKIKGENNSTTPEAILGDFCLLLRKGVAK